MKKFNYNEFKINIEQISVNEFLIKFMNNYNDILHECQFSDMANIEMGLPFSNSSDKINIFDCIPMIKDEYEIYSEDIRKLTWINIFMSLKDEERFNSIYLYKFIEYLDKYCPIYKPDPIIGYQLQSFSLLIQHKQQIEINLIKLSSQTIININDEKYSVNIFDDKFIKSIKDTIINYDKKGEIDSFGLNNEYNYLRDILKLIDNLKETIKKQEVNNDKKMKKITDEISINTFDIKKLYSINNKDDINKTISAIIKFLPIIGTKLSAVLEITSGIKRISSNQKQNL